MTTERQAIRQKDEPSRHGPEQQAEQENEAASPQMVAIGGLHQPPLTHSTAQVRRNATVLQLQRTHGNRSVQRSLTAPRPAPAAMAVQRRPTIQRAPNLPGNALVKIPYAYNWETKLDVGKYVKISKMAFKIEGSLQEMTPVQTTNLSGTTGAPTVSVGGQTDAKDSKKDTVAISLEAKQKADGFFAQKLSSLSKSIKPYQKESAGIKRSDKDVQGKIAYEGGFDVDPFIVDGGKAAFAVEFNLLSIKKEPGKQPDFTVLSAVPKASVGGVAKNFPVDGFQSDLKGELSVTFEPDWTTLAQLLLDCPPAWALALAAGGAALIYFSLKDIDRRAELFNRVKQETRSIIRAAPTYGQALVGEDRPGIGKYEKDAAAKGKADLAKVLADNNMTMDTYKELLTVTGAKEQVSGRGSADYRRDLILHYESKRDDEIRAWHKEHYIQSFFSGNYAADDIAVAEGIVQTEDANNGMDTIG